MPPLQAAPAMRGPSGRPPNPMPGLQAPHQYPNPAARDRLYSRAEGKRSNVGYLRPGPAQALTVRATMYFLKRLAMVVPLLLVISLLAFVLVRVAPGGPFDRERAPASPEIDRALKARYHLDEPIHKQYLRFLSDLAHGDFRPTLKYRNPPLHHLIPQAFPVSMSFLRPALDFA